MLWLDTEDGALNFVEFHQKIRQMHKEGKISEEEHGAYAELLEFNRITLYYSRKSEFEKQVSQLFRIEGICNGNDYACHEQHPIYLLRKRALPTSRGASC